jgi:hypothetical protein
MVLRFTARVTSAIVAVIAFRRISLVPTAALSMDARNQWNIQFDNRNLRVLPVDTIRDPSSRTVKNAIFSFVNPTPVEKPQVVAWSPSALALLGLDPNNTRFRHFDHSKRHRKLIF